MNRTMIGCKCGPRDATVETVLSEVTASVSPGQRGSPVELLTCLPYADVAGERVASPFDFMAGVDARYGEIVSILTEAHARESVTGWAAFEVVEHRTVERAIEVPTGPRWKKVAIVRARPPLGVAAFRQQYARHFIDCRERAMICWKYRQNDVGRHSGMKSRIRGISEFWRDSEEALHLHQYPEVFADTDPFVDHRVGDGLPIVVFGVEVLLPWPA